MLGVIGVRAYNRVMRVLRYFYIIFILLLCPLTAWAGEEQIAEWGEAHYENYGKIEGRTLASSGNFGDYVRSYPDLLAAYNAGFSRPAGDLVLTVRPTQVFLALIYLGICYLAFAPLFRDKNNLIRLDSALIAITVGLLVSGYFYVVPYRFGLPGEYLSVVGLLILAIFNCYRFRAEILPRLGNITFPVYFTFGILFVLYGGFTLIAGMKMGLGDFPPVFFGQDTIERLLQAHELMNINEFPPERLVTKGMLIPTYHIGASAAIAFLSTFTGLAVHKAMFWVVSPLLVLGSFSVLLLIIRTVLNAHSHRFLAMLVFIPEHQWGQTLNDVLFNQTGGSGKWLGENIFGRLVNTEYDPNYFDPDIARVDITHFAGIFCLLLAVWLLINRSNISVFILAPIIVTLSAFAKMNVAFAVVGLIGIRLLSAWTDFDAKRLIGIIISLAVISLLCIFLLGYGDSSQFVNLRSYTDGFDVLSSHLGQSLSQFGRASTKTHFIHTELGYVLGLSALFFLIALQDLSRDRNAVMLVVGSVIVLVICLVAVSFILMRTAWGHLFIPVWISVPLLCLALLTKLAGSAWRRVVISVVLFPVLLIAVVHQWRAMEDIMMVTFSPEKVAKYNDNRALGEAMRAIPVNNSVLVTEELTYLPSGGTVISAKGQRRNALFSSLFGHQMFSSWGRHWYQTEKEREFVQAGIKLQRQRLGPNFNYALIDFSNRTKQIAKLNGWTHFLLRLEPDIEDARKIVDIPLQIIFFNREWAIYKF